MLREYDKVARECARDGVDHPRYLLRLLEMEFIDRERRLIERRIRQARFPATSGQRSSCACSPLCRAPRSRLAVLISATYRTHYWNTIRGDDLPAGIDLMVFDFGVNAGPARAVRLLQEAVGAFPDGAIGPATLRAVRGVNDTAALVDRLAAARIAYYRSLGTFAAFGCGWVKRVEQVRQKARGMVSAREA